MLSDDSAGVLVADVRHDVEFRRPEFELTLPVDQGREGDCDEVGSSAVTLLVERVQKRDRLDGLAQTHFVGQYDVGAALPAVASPVQTFQLRKNKRGQKLS